MIRPTLTALLLALTATSQALASDTAPGRAPAEPGRLAEAFERLKTLVGTWDEAEYGRVVEYRLTGRGSALIEEFVGDPPMASVYHLDGGDLRLTHYCNAGNQPRMRAASFDPETATLAFEFVDVTNLSAPEAYHTRELTIRFADDDRVVLGFTGLKEGREIATTHTLTRRSEASVSAVASPAPAASLDAAAAFDRMKAALVGEWRGRTIGFELVDVTNLSRSGNRYTRKMVVSFAGEDRASITYIGVDEEQEGTLTADLVRVR